MPITPALIGRPEASDLPGATAETDALQASDWTTEPTLRGEEATVSNVSAALTNASWIHLACHADADPVAPSRSRILLFDGDLDVPTIARLRSEHAELAYLSACSTAVSGLDQADEAITVATAFRIAGYRHVIGTLWPLGDTIAVRAATAFYATLLEDGSTPDRAALGLHRTISELRSVRPSQPQQWAQLIHIGP